MKSVSDEETVVFEVYERLSKGFYTRVSLQFLLHSQGEKTTQTLKQLEEDLILAASLSLFPMQEIHSLLFATQGNERECLTERKEEDDARDEMQGEI
jgi:hypothetical protein